MTEAARPISLDLEPRPSRLRLLAGAAAIIGALVVWLQVLGRNFVCACGEVRLWQGTFTPAENSQQFADWYSALHMIFGVGLFAFIRRMRPHWPIEQKLVVVLASSAIWEAIENIPAVIALFQEPSEAFAYSGDSILNSLGDTMFVLLGSGLAATLPWWMTLALVLFAELTVTLMINDGLILGTIRLFGADL